jgi:DNA-binding XRE family transcriptional regulator
MGVQTYEVIDQRIGRTVRALIAARDITVDDVAVAIDISRGSLFSKFKGTAPFKAWEVAALADYFGVPIADLYEGLATRLGVHIPAPTGGPERRRADRRVRNPCRLRWPNLAFSYGAYARAS